MGIARIAVEALLYTTATLNQAWRKKERPCYPRLFVRYPGLEDSKLATEGMSGGEKFKMGYNIANASADMAMSGFSPIGAISSVQDIVSITRTIRAAMVSLSVSFASWEKSVEDQQQLLAGKAFKSIPIQPANLAFVQETK